MTNAPPSDPAGPPSGRQAGFSGRRSIRGLWFGLAGGFILVTGCLVALALNYLRDQAIEAGRRLTETYAHVIAEQSARTIQLVDQRLELAGSRLAQLSAGGGLNPGSARDLLRQQIQELPFVRAMWVMDAQGRIQYDSDPGNIGVDLHERPYFQIYLARPDTVFQLGNPVRSRSTGTWLISAARPLQPVNGNFAGIVVAAVEPPYLDKLWSTINLGAGGSISLFRRDGTLLLRSPHDDAALGKAFPDLPVFKAPLANSPSGSFQNASAIDGVHRLFAYRALPMRPDLMVVVGQASATVLAPWWRMAVVAIAVWAMASAAVATLCVFLDRAWRQRMRSVALSEQMRERLTIATDAAGIGVWDWDLKSDKWYATPTYFSMMGVEPHEGLSPSGGSLELVHPDDRSAIVATMQAVLTGTDTHYEYEARVRHADGAYRWLRLLGRVLERDASGKAIRMLGVRIDVSARRQAQEALEHARDHAENLISSANAMIIGIDRAGAITLFNQAAERITGYTAAEVMGRNSYEVLTPPERIAFQKERLKVAITGAFGKLAENQILTKSGQRRFISWQNSEIREGGQTVGILSFGIDMTERRLAEKALKRSEKHLRDLIDGMGPSMFVGLLKPDGTLLEASPHAIIDAGLEPEQVLGQPLDQTYWYDYSDEVQTVLRTAINRGASGEASRFDIQTRMGPSRFLTIDFSIQPLRDENGQASFLVASARDVTDRRHAEDALRSSEESYRMLVERSPYAIAIQQDNIVVMANPAALVLFGAESASQLVGKHVRDLVHPDFHEPGRARTQRMLRGETGLYPWELRYLRLDGSAFDVEASATPLILNGRPAVQIIALDITQRKQAEAALRESTHKLQVLSRLVLAAQETERRRVAHELHDELGQALTAIKINLQARERFKDRSPADLNAENLRIVEDAIKQVRRLALALRPSMLDDLGLVPALHWITEQTAARGGLAIHFRPVVPAQRLVPEIETACFRIVQEALTNIMRYAQARRVDIDLLQDGAALVLCVQDDGCGFDLATVRKRALAGGSIGVLGMQERASLIGGQLEIASKPGVGTTIRLRCPWRTQGETI